MTILVRKIDRGKWLQNNILEGEDISADAITNCTRTTKNTLSTWSIPSEDDLQNAVLAIVSGHQHLDSIDIVCLTQESLADEGIIIEETNGSIPIDSLKDTHRDLSNITYLSLGIIANKIKAEIIDGKVIRFTKGKLKKILNDAISAGLLPLDQLSPHIVSKL